MHWALRLPKTPGRWARKESSCIGRWSNSAGLTRRCGRLLAFERSVDGGIGAYFVVCLLNPFLQCEVAGVDLRHPALSQHDPAKNTVVHGDQCAIQTKVFGSPKLGQLELHRFDRDLTLQLLERGGTQADSAQVEAHQEIFRSFAGIRVADCLK